MTKERLFRIIGLLDDKILERYHAIDQRLARKQANKKRALRVLAIAACAALLLGACIPVGMMIAQMGQGTPPDTPGISGTSWLCGSFWATPVSAALCPACRTPPWWSRMRLLPLWKTP